MYKIPLLLVAHYTFTLVTRKYQGHSEHNIAPNFSPIDQEKGFDTSRAQGPHRLLSVRGHRPPGTNSSPISPRPPAGYAMMRNY